MLTLGVATRAETYERVREPLAERDIRVEHVATEGIYPLAEPLEGIDVGFVFPSRLMAGGAVDALLDVPWVNDRRAVLRSRNKAEVIARLAAADIPVPETTLVASPADEAALATAVDRLGTPVVVKPNSATHGEGVVRVADVDSVLGVADYFGMLHSFPATRDRTFLVQEFLPGASDYRAMVVDGTYAGAVERRLDADRHQAGGWKHNVHRGAVAHGITLADDHQALVERVARTLDIPWLGVDILVTDDRAVVTETNARPTVDAATKYRPDFHDRLAGVIRDAATD